MTFVSRTAAVLPFANAFADVVEDQEKQRARERDALNELREGLARVHVRRVPQAGASGAGLPDRASIEEADRRLAMAEALEGIATFHFISVSRRVSALEPLAELDDPAMHSMLRYARAEERVATDEFHAREADANLAREALRTAIEASDARLHRGRDMSEDPCNVAADPWPATPLSAEEIEVLLDSVQWLADPACGRLDVDEVRETLMDMGMGFVATLMDSPEVRDLLSNYAEAVRSSEEVSV